MSQHEWRLTRRHLNSHRSDLARLAVELYRPDVRVPDTCLLTSPDWMPPAPIGLDQITLRWRDGPASVAIDGTE